MKAYKCEDVFLFFPQMQRKI